MYYLYSMLCLLLVQTQATSAGAAASNAGNAAAGSAGAAPAEAPSFFEQMIYFLPMMLAMMLVYLFVMKPPAKGGDGGKSLELKKNDRVVTVGGIVGTVVKNDAESDTTTLRVDDSGNTRMQFLTSSIAKVLSDEKDKADSSDKK